MIIITQQFNSNILYYYLNIQFYSINLSIKIYQVSSSINQFIFYTQNDLNFDVKSEY